MTHIQLIFQMHNYTSYMHAYRLTKNYHYLSVACKIYNECAIILSKNGLTLKRLHRIYTRE